MNVGCTARMRSEPNLSKAHLRLVYILMPVAGLINSLLPFAGAYIFNKLMRRRNGVTVTVGRISLSPLSKTLAIKRLRVDIEKPDTGGQSRFLTIDTIAIEIDRSALWKGFVVFDLAIEKPEVVYARGMQLPDSFSSSSSPLNGIQAVCNHALISDGSVRYIDSTTTPTVDLYFNRLTVVASGLSNKPHPERMLPADIVINANVCDGLLNAVVKADLSTVHPTFDINAEIKYVSLIHLNELFIAYGHFDVNQGSISAFAEAAAYEGHFKGYVKAEAINLDFLGPEDNNNSVLSRIWQGLLGASVQLLENQKKDQFATKIPFSGTFTNPNIGFWMGVIQVLSNAFVKALEPAIDYEININSPLEKDVK